MLCANIDSLHVVVFTVVLLLLQFAVAVAVVAVAVTGVIISLL